MLVVCDCLHLSYSLTIRGVEKFLENFFNILVLSLRSPESTLKISSPFPKPFLKKPRQTEMATLRKNASQAAVATTSKGNSTAAGGTGYTDTHQPHLDVHIEDVR